MEQPVILGIPFSPVTEETAAGILSEKATAQRGTYTVFTPNPLTVMRAQREPDYAELLRSADLSLADGTGIVGAAKRLSSPLPGRCTGIGTAEKTMKLLAACSGSVFLLGGKPGVAEAAAENLKSRFPGLRILGVHDGFFPEEEADGIVREIAAASPDLLCVCLGAPKQEQFLCTHRAALHVGCAMALGGSLDVWSGRVRRAPGLFLRLRAEWLWRMLCEPKRFANLPDLVRFRFRTRRRKNAKDVRN